MFPLCEIAIVEEISFFPLFALNTFISKDEETLLASQKIGKIFTKHWKYDFVKVKHLINT